MVRARQRVGVVRLLVRDVAGAGAYLISIDFRNQNEPEVSSAGFPKLTKPAVGCILTATGGAQPA